MDRQQKHDRARIEREYNLALNEPDRRDELAHDLWILERIIVSIRMGSRWWRHGYIKALRRTIQRLQRMQAQEKGPRANVSPQER